MRDQTQVNQTWNLFIPLSLLVSALGLGGITVLVPEFYGSSVPLSAQYAMAALAMVSAVSLSVFIIRALEGAKKRGTALLDEMAAGDRAKRTELEKEFGSDQRALVLANTGKALSSAAALLEVGILILTLIKLSKDNPRVLPTALVMTHSAVTSASNLLGFSAITVLGARIEKLLERHNEEKSKSKDIEIEKGRKREDKLMAIITSAGISLATAPLATPVEEVTPAGSAAMGGTGVMSPASGVLAESLAVVGSAEGMPSVAPSPRGRVSLFPAAAAEIILEESVLNPESSDEAAAVPAATQASGTPSP